MASVRGKPRPPVSKQAALIGDALRDRRTSPAINKRQEDIALDAGLSQKLVSQIERGEQDLRTSGFNTILGILKALGWTLGDLQAATNIDFGLGVQMESTQMQQVNTEYQQQPVYKLESLIQSNAQPYEYSWLPPAKGEDKSLTRALLIEDTDMERMGRSLHPDDIIFVRTDELTPIPDNLFAVAVGGKVIVRRYVQTPIGAAFVADNPALSGQLLSPDNVRILGHVYRVFSDFNNFSN
jgi:SOS-response transcriptional repressor LexA